MIRSEDLKRIINSIPDGSVVTLGGNWNVNIESVTVETTSFDYLQADLKLSDGFSIVKDGFVSDLFDELRRACERRGRG